MTRPACLVLSLLAPFAFAVEEPAAPGDLDTYLKMSVVRRAEISPTGTHVAWRVFQNDFEDDRYDEQLWVAAVAGGEALQLTRGDTSVGDFEWSPDGHWLAFLRGGAVFAMRIAGGEAMELELDGVDNVSDLRFSPDGSALFFTASAKADDWQRAREAAYGKYQLVREEGDYKHIWRQDLSASMEIVGDAQALTEGREFSVTAFALSPDGEHIAFTAWPTPHLADLLKGKVYTLPAAGGEVRVLADEPGVESDIVWREDGARLAFSASPGFPDYAGIVTLAADGSGHRRFDLPDYDPQLIRYDAAGLLFGAGVRTRFGRYRLDTNSGAVRALDQGGIHFSTTLSRDGARMASVSAMDGGLAEVRIEGPALTRTLTDFNAQLVGLRRPEQTLIQWESFDGLVIEGVLTWPLDYDDRRRYPLFVRTHGGPTGTDRPGLMFAPRSLYPPAVLAAQGEGAFVLQSNYRGSAAYGAAFQKTNYRQLGIGPARDIIAGVEQLVAEGRVDPERVGCLGWSQGGHISAMLATYSDICTAAIMGAGISDWRTYYYNTDITQFTTEYFGATPFEDDAVYALTSPVTYIDNASTPTLIQHGERDARVPIANGYQLRQLLLDRGVESRMVVYADMGHGPGKPRHLRAITEHALAWFDEYLFGGSRAELRRPLPPEDTDDACPQLARGASPASCSDDPSPGDSSSSAPGSGGVSLSGSANSAVAASTSRSAS